VNYAPDANEIAARNARRERAHRDAVAAETGTPVQVKPSVVRGKFSLWLTRHHALNDGAPIQSSHVTLDLTKPGLVIAYAENGDAEILVPSPGMYMTFEPDREGE
jgi:hypothetical protein